MEKRVVYSVIQKRIEGPSVATLALMLPGKGMPKYRAGQYIIVYFPELGTPEGKAYSISSAPSEGVLTITVRAIGRFSNRLVSMEPGETITASLPYGFFYTESTGTPIVMIAAGIGITPFRSMVRDSIEKQPSRKISLFHSSRTIADAVFRGEFEKLTQADPRFTLGYFITRERVNADNAIVGRVTVPKLASILGELPQAEYMICGPASFTRSLREGLRLAGISERALYTEDLYPG